MEKCQQCGLMTAEMDHYTGELICYNNKCGHKQSAKKSNSKPAKSASDSSHSVSCPASQEKNLNLK